MGPEAVGGATLPEPGVQATAEPDLTSGVVEETITSPLFQTPTTVAIHGNRLAAANAKFDTGLPPTADEYEIVIVDR